MRNILISVLIFLGMASNAQKSGNELVDSLLSQIPAQKNDTLKARIYNRVYNELTLINADEALKIAWIGLAHTHKMKWPKGIAVFQSNIGSSYSDMGNYDSSLFYFNAALATHSKLNDKYNMASTYNNMGVAAKNIRSDYTTAATYTFKALKLAEEINDSTLISISLSNAARVYSSQMNHAKALEFDTRALRVREKSGTPDEVASSLESIGKTYYFINKNEKAKEFFHKALFLYESTGNLTGLASVYTSLPLVYGTDYRKIIETRIKAKKLWDEINPIHTDALTNTGNLGLAFFDIVRYGTNRLVKYGNIIPDNKQALLKKAREYLENTIQLATQTGDIDTKSYFTGVLAEVQAYEGEYKNAYYNYKLYKETQDSLYSQENKNKIAATESQREIDKKNSELEISKLTLINKQRTLLGLIGGLVLLAVIGFLFYRQSQQRKKTNIDLTHLNNELDKANKVKAKFFAILSHDLRSPLSSILNLIQLQKNDNETLTKEQLIKLNSNVEKSTESLLETIDTMLLWSKSQMENFTASIQHFPASRLFENLSKIFSNYPKLNLHFDDPYSIMLETDENFIQVILYNLTANAINASRNNNDINIVWRAWKEKNRIRLSITDNGPGLSREQAERILKDTPINSSKNGLGIYLIKDIARIIKADISIDFTSENGTSFIISFN